MRSVRVMNIPVGVLAAWILVLGYALWAVEAAVASPTMQNKLPCSVVEITAPANNTCCIAKATPNNS